MTNYFDKFPQIPYSIGRTDDKVAQFQLATNIMVRVRVLVEALDRVFNYYEYVVKDGETPEILAEKVYGDPEAHWLILLTNNITDPVYDWPLRNDVFDKYLISKYGSMETAKTTYHHYEIVYRTYDTLTFSDTFTRIHTSQNPVSNVIIQNRGLGLANGFITISSDYGIGGNIGYTVNANGGLQSVTIYNGGSYISAPNLSIGSANTSTPVLVAYCASGNTWSSLPDDVGSYTSQTINGRVVNTYLPYRNKVTNYDWEFEENERKRNIKLIKPDYYSSIVNEFNSLMASSGVSRVIPGIRTVT